MAILGKIKVIAGALLVLGSIILVGNISLRANAAMVDIPVDLASVTEAGTVQPLGTAEWKYKIKDGNLYKRLMDIKTGQWIGDWILVGPV